MTKFEIRYLDSMTGETVGTWTGEAKDYFEAMDMCHQDDYYVGEILSVEEIDG